MRKTIHTIFALAAVVTLWAGCSDDTRSDESTGHAIDFSCDAVESRTQEATADNMTSFRVSAVWAKSSGEYVDGYMDGQLVEKNNTNNWVYSPEQYIPTSGTVDFFAYSPADAAVSDFSITGQTHDRVSLIYDVSTDVLRQHDFMVAEALEVNTPSVFLNFQHLLSSITVEAKSVSPGYLFRVREVKLLNIYRRGVLTGTTSGSPRETAWVWSNQTIPTTYDIVQNGPADAIYGSYTVISDPATGPLMILPQVSGADAYLYVVYEECDNGGNKLGDVTSAFFLDTNFEMGKKYILRINFEYQGTRSSGAASSTGLHFTVEAE